MFLEKLSRPFQRSAGGLEDLFERRGFIMAEDGYHDFAASSQTGFSNGQPPAFIRCFDGGEIVLTGGVDKGAAGEK